MATDATHSLDHHSEQHSSGAAISVTSTSNTSSNSGSTGSSIQNDDINQALNQVTGTTDDHNHARPTSAPNLQQTDNGDFEQHDGTEGSERITGSDRNDFLMAGNSLIQGAASGDGPSEFPFPNDSPAITNVNFELENGRLRIDGVANNLDGAPLFSQGETEIDPTATILNGSDPQALIDGFLEVPEDSEGNTLTGTHLHFSPTGDSRGNFADATVIRYVEDTPTSDKSAKLTGEFNLNPEEQAAFAAGNLYLNLHTNVDVDQDGRAGFPTGENRVNFNQNVVQP
ncbi:CHRD domain-containing protein [Leptolyngbya sp. NIES-2104]|uniref:CHRD domain-containing protein n=1 Tax=Leptolyngbya sp. NIES-2104 TaxID=1552121 RepID=UPI0006EC7DC9|nr:CHRD domain-containing protein [Leptolyngbya sp. NIES-2104]GAP99589.1 hypothetical protein NIES2104_61550 [Leptolyngbya sp. NIES-2104]